MNPDDEVVRMTREEFQRALRKAFVVGRKGAVHGTHRGFEDEHCGVCEYEARLCYPIKKRVGRRARLAGGVTVRIENDFVLFEREGKPYPLTQFGSASFKIVQDLLANPYEEVDE